MVGDGRKLKVEAEARGCRGENRAAKRAGTSVATVDVAATGNVAALNGKNNAKGIFINCGRQLVAGNHRAGLDVLGAKNPRYLTNQVQIGVSTAGGYRLGSP